MGMAKYHEDNMEMWEERNRDWWLRPEKATPPKTRKAKRKRTKNTAMLSGSTAKSITTAVLHRQK